VLLTATRARIVAVIIAAPRARITMLSNHPHTHIAPTLTAAA
jgi:hypothetical protein